TFLGQSNQAVDLVGDLDAAANTLSLGRLATYDASNVKVTSANSGLTLGATINALLFAGDGLTANVSGTTTVTSGEIVNFGGAVLGNAITGGTLAFGAAEPLFFTQGADNVQQLNLNGATSGQFTLTLVVNPPSVQTPTFGTSQT